VVAWEGLLGLWSVIWIQIQEWFKYGVFLYNVEKMRSSENGFVEFFLEFFFFFF
jgi:hypothetical protein